MRSVLFAFTAASLLAVSAVAWADEAPDTSVPPTLVELGLGWKRPPSIYDMARFYPARAKALRISRGEAIVDCTPDGNGTLACSLVEEFPSEGLFGEAALKVMRTATVAAEAGDSPAGRTFRFSLKFGYWPPHLLPDYVQLDSFGLRWVRTPLVSQYWRGAGLPKGETFTVDLACVADASGAPICEVTDDRFASQGYARGVVKAMARAKIATLDGEPVAGKTFNYRLTTSAD